MSPVNHNKRLPCLRAGDRIGVAAPASPFDRECFDAGVKILEEMGFDVVCPKGIFSRHGYLAGTDAHRLAIIHSLFADKMIKAIWCARGGYGSMRLLPHLDVELIRRNPKVLIGCSDITAVLNFLYAQCGMVSFHGPMIITLSRADKRSIDSLKSALTGKQLITISADAPITYVSGCSTGPVSGGNLSTLSHLLGTPFFPDFSGSIVFMEDVGEKPYRIDRMLTQLILSGCFDHAAGICLGHFHNCGETEKIHQVLIERLSSLSIPVLAGFPAGHDMPSLVVPIGLVARLDTVAGSLSYLESAMS